MNAKVVWQQRMSFDASADSGFHLPLGTDPDVGGDHDGFRPMELIALGLAGCTAMDVISILQKKRQQVTRFEVATELGRAQTHPKVFTDATLEYRVTGHDVDEAAVRRAIELSATRYCPAQAMLGQVMSISMQYVIFAEAAEGEPQVVTRGALIIPALEPPVP
jgi:putative redox protein